MKPGLKPLIFKLAIVVVPVKFVLPEKLALPVKFAEPGTFNALLILAVSAVRFCEDNWVNPATVSPLKLFLGL